LHSSKWGRKAEMKMDKTLGVRMGQILSRPKKGTTLRVEERVSGGGVCGVNGGRGRKNLGEAREKR